MFSAWALIKRISMLSEFVRSPEHVPNLNRINLLATQGLKKHFLKVTHALSDRLAYELNVIESINCSTYFLLLCDIIQFVNRLGYCHFCPGNANASLVCFCLGLTDINPIEHDLLFESFIIPGQEHLPDFNLEFDSTEKLQATKAILSINWAPETRVLFLLVISGRKNLKAQLDAIKQVQKKQGTKINPWNLPLDDKKTWTCLQKREKNKPVCFDDLLAIVSLNNQKSGKAIKQYFFNRNNPERISYPHPALEPVLESTMGVLMFQDQILRILQIIGGFTLEEADSARKALENKNVVAKQAAAFSANAARRKIEKKNAMAIFANMKEVASSVLFKSEAVGEALSRLPVRVFQGAFSKGDSCVTGKTSALTWNVISSFLP